MDNVIIEFTDLNIRKAILRFMRESDYFLLYNKKYLYSNSTYDSYLNLRVYGNFTLFRIVKYLKLQSLIKVITNPKHEYYKKLIKIFGKYNIDNIIKHASEIYLHSMNSLTYEIFAYGLKTLTDFDKEDRRRLTRIEQREMHNLLTSLT